MNNNLRHIFTDIYQHKSNIQPSYELQLRDQIATSVISKILEVQGQFKYSYGGCENILYENCQLAYKIADAMLNVRIGKSYYDTRLREGTTHE